MHTSPVLFHYLRLHLRFGNVLLGMHHSHACKVDKLPGVMACDQAKYWGEITHRHCLTGHIHHETKKEYAGCTVESFTTLAGKDCFSRFSGTLSDRFDDRCHVRIRRGQNS